MLSAADSLRAAVVEVVARVLAVAVAAASDEEGGKFGDCGICGPTPRAC